MTGFGSGSTSNGQFWYGNSTKFPGFLYKKNVGVGGKRTTRMNPGGNLYCNKSQDLYNKYKPGQSGIGASSISNRRAKNRHATVCNESAFFPCFMSLGQYNHYLYNPRGLLPCDISPAQTIMKEKENPYFTKPNKVTITNPFYNIL
jgi:hypothetical protein